MLSKMKSLVRTLSRRSRRAQTAPESAVRGGAAAMGGAPGPRPASVGDPSDAVLVTAKRSGGVVVSVGATVHNDAPLAVEPSELPGGVSAVDEAVSREKAEAKRNAERKKRMAALVRVFGDAIVDKLLCRKWDERVEAFGMVKRTVEKRVVELRAAGDVEEATRLFRAACKIAERGVHDKVPPVYLAAIDLVGTIVEKALPEDATARRKGMTPLFPPIVRACSTSNARVAEKSQALLLTVAQTQQLGTAELAPHVLAPVSGAKSSVVSARLRILAALLAQCDLGESSGFTLDNCMELILPALSHAEVKTRKQAIVACVEVYKQAGIQVTKYTSTLPAAMLRKLDKRFAKADGRTPASGGRGTPAADAEDGELESTLRSLELGVRGASVGSPAPLGLSQRPLRSNASSSSLEGRLAPANTPLCKVSSSKENSRRRTPKMKPLRKDGSFKAMVQGRSSALSPKKASRKGRSHPMDIDESSVLLPGGLNVSPIATKAEADAHVETWHGSSAAKDPSPLGQSSPIAAVATPVASTPGAFAADDEAMMADILSSGTL